MENSFEKNPVEERDSVMRKRLEIIIGNLGERAANEGLEIEPMIFRDETAFKVSVEISLRAIPSDMDIKYESKIFEGNFSADEWASASSEQISLWQEQIKEGYIRASRDIFVIAGKKALFRAVQAESQAKEMRSKPIPIDAKQPEKGKERKAAQAA